MKFYSHKRSAKPPSSNLYLQFKSDQQQDIDTFMESFSQAIEISTQKERQTYPKHYDPPHPDQRIIDDDTAEKLIPSIARNNVASFYYHQEPHTKKFLKQSTTPLCQHDDEFDCECVLPSRERKTIAFMRKYEQNDCFEFFKVNREVFFNVEIVKALLLHGEMDLLLRICSIPGVNYTVWKRMSQCFCMDQDLGWNQLYRAALGAYVVLNVLYSFPKLHKGKQSKEDYRDTECYQRLLHSCTRPAATDITRHLHRSFFGIPDNHFTATSSFEWEENEIALRAISRREERLALWNTSREQRWA